MRAWNWYAPLMYCGLSIGKGQTGVHFFGAGGWMTADGQGQEPEKIGMYEIDSLFFDLNLLSLKSRRPGGVRAFPNQRP